MAKLEEIGFRKNWIYETLVLTDRAKHCAPMGVSTPDYKTLTLNVYKSSQTCANILTEGEFTIGLANNIMQIYTALAGKDVKDSMKNTLKVRVSSSYNLGESIRFTCTLIDTDVSDDVMLLNRAQHLMLESLIEHTKPEPRINRISENADIIRKVAPGSDYQKIVEKLLKKPHLHLHHTP